MADLHDAHSDSVDRKEFGLGSFEDRKRDRRGSGAEIKNSVGHVYLTELRIKNLSEQDSTTPNINEFGNTR